MLAFFTSKQPELAIDFGTANLRIIHRNEGIVFDEPSLCCFEQLDTKPSLHAAGQAAKAMIDRTPRQMQIKRPLHRGVLQDLEAATQLLRYALPKVRGRNSSRGSSVIVGVPADATQAERNALVTATRDAGLGRVQLISEPLAAAIGANLPINQPVGSMIVECGAGTTEVAILSLGDICLTRSVRGGGAAFDKAIADYLHFHHKFLIGDLTAERVKQEYVASRAVIPAGKGTITVKGRGLISQVPDTINLSLTELDDIAAKHMQHIVDVIREILNEAPPELSHDIYDQGVVLTGGAVTPTLRFLIEQQTGLSVTAANDAAQCVTRGLSSLLLR